MKKRLLSMLLLVAMIVTALPLVTFSVTADEPENTEWKKEDYDALYVTDGALLLLDYYALNSHWGETMTLPEPPTRKTAYQHTDGKTYDFTKVENRLKAADTWIVMRQAGDDYLTWSYMDANGTFSSNNGTSAKGTGTDAGTYATEAEALAAAYAASGLTTEQGDAKTFTNGGYTYYVAQKTIAKGDAWKKAVDDYFTELNALLNRYSALKTPTSSFAAFQTELGYKSHLTPSGNVFDTAVFAPQNGNGSITLLQQHTNAYITVGNLPATGSVHMELVMTPGVPAAGKTATNGQYVTLRRSPLRGTVNAGGVTFTQTNTYSGLTGVDFADVTVSGSDTIFTLAYLDTRGDNLTRTGTIGIDGVDKVTFTGTDTTATDAGNTMLVHDSYFLSYSLYAARFYSRALTPTERAQNHFADLMKWYKIDITDLKKLSNSDLTLDFYEKFAGFRIGDDESLDDIVLALKNAVTSAFQEKYAGLSSAWVALAFEYGLDLSSLMTQPKGMMANTVKFLNGGYLNAADVKAEYNAALEKDLFSSPMSMEGYNALYVQDGLQIALDYFTSNSIWDLPAVATNNAQYLWKWTSKTATGIGESAGTFSKGGLVFASNVYMGNETSKMDGEAANGTTVEYIFTDDKVTTGTFLDIDDLRIYAGAATGNTVTITAIGQRDYSRGALRLPAATEGGEFGKLSGSTKAPVASVQLSLDAPNSLVLQMKRPAMTRGWYTYYYINENADVVRPTIAQMKVDTQDALDDAILGTKDRNGNRAGGGTYFYITHRLVDGVLVEEADCTIQNTSTPAEANKHQYAYFIPVYYEQGGARYIVDCIDRTTNNGIGYGSLYATTDAEGNISLCDPTANFYDSEYGSLAISVNGETVFSRNDLIFPNQSGLVGGTYLRYGYNVTRTAYAYRSYNRTLSAAELAQNHFADVAKYYQLTLTGYDALVAANDTVALKKLYASVADISIVTGDRVAAQNAVSAVLNESVNAMYAEMKAEHPTLATFIDVACDYRLDIDTVLASKRDMSSVYALSFDGLTCDAAQLLLDEVYLDAYYYLSYQVDDADGTDETAKAWNAMMKWCADHEYMIGANRVDLEALMALPYDERVGILDKTEELQNAQTIAAAQAIIDAYVVAAMEKYATTGEDEKDFNYNALYVTDGALLLADFFALNSAWGGEIEWPVSPNVNSAYVYSKDSIPYDFTKVENRLSDGIKWIVVRQKGTDTSTWGMLRLGGDFSTVAANVTDPVSTGKDYGATEIMVYDTEDVAKIAILLHLGKEIPMTADAGDYSYSAEAVKVTIKDKNSKDVEVTKYRLARKDAEENVTYLLSDGTYAAEGDVKLFATAADAMATVADTAELDATFTGADEYTYYAVKKYAANASTFLKVAPAYDEAKIKYQAEMEKILNAYIHAGSGTLQYYLPGAGNQSYQDASGALLDAPFFTAEDGYIRVHTVHGNAYLSVKGLPAEGVVYTEGLFAASGTNKTNSNFFMLREVQIAGTKNDNGFSIGQFNEYNNASTVGIYTAKGSLKLTTATPPVADGEVFSLGFLHDRQGTGYVVVRYTLNSKNQPAEQATMKADGTYISTYDATNYPKTYATEAEALAAAFEASGLEGDQTEDTIFHNGGYYYTAEPYNARNNIVSLWMNGVQYADKLSIPSTATKYVILKNQFANTIFSFSAQGSYARDIYALRFYDRDLTATERAQNHFADLAKYYKLDISRFAEFTADMRTELYAAVAGYAVGSASKVTLQSIYNEVAADLFAGTVILEDEAENARFLALAAVAMLDLSPIENLKADEREALAAKYLATFDPNYSVNPDIVAYYYNADTYAMSIMTFAGYQVRVTTGSTLADYAGVRAVFDVDLDRIEEIAKTGEPVVLRTSVLVNGEGDDYVEKAYLLFTFTWNADEEKLDVVGTNNSASGTKEAVLYTRTDAAGNEITSFNYTVTFKGEDRNADLIHRDFFYGYSISVGEETVETNSFDVNSRTFGRGVSAASLYQYFAAHGYADDPVVNGMVTDFPGME